MIDLEDPLRDLGEHLDHPDGDLIVPRLRARLSTPVDRPHGRSGRRRRRVLVTALASAAAAVLLAVAIPPSRDAIADILGLGSGGSAPRDRSAVPREHRPGPTVTTAPAPAVAALDLETARAVVDFPIGVPARVGVPPQVTVDAGIPGGLVALDYPTFRVVEVASPPDVAEALADLIAPESHLRTVSIRGRTGMWITGTHHEIAYLDRDGAVRRGATRPTGHVLLWEENGVTYRVEGFADEASAMEMASSIA